MPKTPHPIGLLLEALSKHDDEISAAMAADLAQLLRDGKLPSYALTDICLPHVMLDDAVVVAESGLDALLRRLATLVTTPPETLRTADMLDQIGAELAKAGYLEVTYHLTTKPRRRAKPA